jgi:hypothetical protein
MPTSELPTPYATLLDFARYVGRSGPAKATYVGGLRRRRTGRSGFNPHGPLIKAMKADSEWRSPGVHLRRVVEEVKPRWRPLYEALLPGTLFYVESLGDLSDCRLAQARDVLAMVDALPIKINPQLALRYTDGRAEAVRLYFDAEPPTPEAVLATLHLMAGHIDRVLPGARPVVVDIRRACVHRSPPHADSASDKRSSGQRANDGSHALDVERWLRGEAAAFTAIWGTAA